MASTHARHGYIDLVGIAVFLFLAYAGLVLPFPQNNGDELANLSYALQLRDHHFSPIPLGELILYRTDTHQPTAQPSYLNHTAIGYYPLALFTSMWPNASIFCLRVFCFFPAMLAYLLYQRIGRAAELNLSGYVLYTLFPSLLCLPVHLALINTDQWVTLGGTCIVLGWLRWRTHVAQLARRHR